MGQLPSLCGDWCCATEHRMFSPLTALPFLYRCFIVVLFCDLCWLLCRSICCAVPELLAGPGFEGLCLTPLEIWVGLTTRTHTYWSQNLAYYCTAFSFRFDSFTVLDHVGLCSVDQCLVFTPASQLHVIRIIHKVFLVSPSNSYSW